MDRTNQVTKSRQGLEIVRTPPVKRSPPPTQVWSKYGKAKRSDG